MTPEIYRQAGELFERLRLLPPPEWKATLETACNGDEQLRTQVVQLLVADRDAGHDFLDGWAVDDAARLIPAPALENPKLPAPGTVFGNYCLGERIGAGGMGVVYEGRDLRLDRRVALKILPVPPALEADERIRRFQREAHAASTLNHPHIVSIFAADFDQGYHYIAMEFVEGRTLRQIIREQPPAFDSQTLLDWIWQAASALAAAHEAGIVHRDVKPENIIVRPDGFVKVLDFGLAKLREPPSTEENTPDLQTRPGSLAGTIHYLSPEQISGITAGPQSDVFSLGVVAYELATGKRPFEGPTDGAVFNAILNRTPPLPSAVRPALGTDLDALIMRALEKDPAVRFQAAGELRSSCRITRDYVARALEREHGSASQPGQSSSAAERDLLSRPVKSRRLKPLQLTALALAMGAFLVWFTRPLAPRVTQIAQITTDGETKHRFVNDGVRLFYAAGNLDPDIKMFQINLKGGDPVPMPRLTGMLPLDISPDHSEILLGQILKGPGYQGDGDGPFPIWMADTLGNPPRRLGDLSAQEARWSPSGDQILYSNGSELRIARSDGSQSDLVAQVKGNVRSPQWSPDGRRIRFTLASETASALWEVKPDGTHLRELFPDRAGLKPESGTWTPDGKYFIFVDGQAGARDLWAVRQTSLEALTPGFLRLTRGPMKAYLPQASADARHIFFLGKLVNGQLVRYDRKSNQWTPYLGGLAAMHLDFSRDGKWITYIRCPDASLWRMTSDGGERLQLTAPPLNALNPRWSPDGKQIAFYGSRPGEDNRLYVAPAGGGAVRQLTDGKSDSSAEVDASWSPDSRSLVTGARFGDISVDEQHRLALELVDVKTKHVSKLPGSQSLSSPRWSPDGRNIAALGPGNRLWLYSVETHARTQLTQIGAGWPTWSANSQYVYFEDNPGIDWLRVSIKDRKVENVTSLIGLKMAPPSLSWVGLAPDGAPISTRDIGGTEIYALDWEIP
jgi:serine/threonine protein kinase/Tol biopolymer transport system component